MRLWMGVVSKVFSTTQQSLTASTSAANPNVSPWTWTNAPIGDADANRYVLIMFTADANKASTLTISIGGQPTTLSYAQAPTTNEYYGYAYANVPTGTTADIVFTTTAGGAKVTDISVSAFRLIGYNMTPEDAHTGTGTTVQDTAFNTSAGASIFGAFITDTANTNISWTNLTEAQEVALATSDSAEAYSFTVSGGTITVAASTTGGTTGFGIFISLAPA